MTNGERKMVERLARRIAGLNPNSREIGAGMLATLQAEAAAVLEIMSKEK